ncbi:MAG: bile acid:sodium symporter [Bacteriovorax sp.]|jgi:predicted Na+-dependent transporter
MLNIFGLPILIAFVLGYFFPYVALSLSPYAFIVLFMMMTASALDIKWSIIKQIRSNKFEMALGLFFLFLFFPLIQWFLAKTMIAEESLFYGTMLASLCPVAIVAPGFTKMHNGDEDLSFLLMIASMILFPLAVLFALSITHQTMHMKPIIIDMMILIFFPLALGEIIKRIDQKFFAQTIIKGWKNWAAEFNMFAIAFLAFIYLGASVSKLNLSYTPWKELLAVLFIIMFQDFGVYFLCRFITRRIFAEDKAQALTISISMKNLAVSGAILLIYDPKASLASAMGFFVHALFFNFLVMTRPNVKPKK